MHQSLCPCPILDQGHRLGSPYYPSELTPFCSSFESRSTSGATHTCVGMQIQQLVLSPSVTKTFGESQLVSTRKLLPSCRLTVRELLATRVTDCDISALALRGFLAEMTAVSIRNTTCKAVYKERLERQTIFGQTALFQRTAFTASFTRNIAFPRKSPSLLVSHSPDAQNVPSR
jgi:hypothetical protein